MKLQPDTIRILLNVIILAMNLFMFGTLIYMLRTFDVTRPHKRKMIFLMFTTLALATFSILRILDVI